MHCKLRPRASSMMLAIQISHISCTKCLTFLLHKSSCCHVCFSRVTLLSLFFFFLIVSVCRSIRLLSIVVVVRAGFKVYKVKASPEKNVCQLRTKKVGSLNNNAFLPWCSSCHATRLSERPEGVHEIQ